MITTAGYANWPTRTVPSERSGISCSAERQRLTACSTGSAHRTTTFADGAPKQWTTSSTRPGWSKSWPCSTTPTREYGSRHATPSRATVARTTAAVPTQRRSCHTRSDCCATTPTDTSAPTPLNWSADGYTATTKQPTHSPTLETTTRHQRSGRRQAGTRPAAPSTARQHHAPAAEPLRPSAPPQRERRAQMRRCALPHDPRWFVISSARSARFAYLSGGAVGSSALDAPWWRRCSTQLVVAVGCFSEPSSHLLSHSSRSISSSTQVPSSKPTTLPSGVMHE